MPLKQKQQRSKEINKCPQCQETCLNAQVLERHIQLLHDPSRVPVPPVVPAPLFFLDYVERWLEIINNANNEDKTHARQTLKKIKALAEKALRSTMASGCLSHPHFGSETKQTVEKLIWTLGVTEGYLRDLNKHLVSLVGLGDPEHGQLAEWTGYQSGTGNTPDPGDIIDDMEFIEACLLKVQNKTLAVTETHQCTQCHDVFRRACFNETHRGIS